MKTMHLLTALLLAALPATAAAQQDPGARIEAALQAAAQANIPVSLLESKVREGEAKRVPAERIAAAVEARLAALIDARETLDGAGIEPLTEAELSVAADALLAGVEASALVRLSRTSPDDRRVVAIAVLAQLVQLGYDSDPALARVNAALEAGPEALANLRAEVAASLRVKGILPIGVDAGVFMGLRTDEG